MKAESEKSGFPSFIPHPSAFILCLFAGPNPATLFVRVVGGVQDLLCEVSVLKGGGAGEFGFSAL